MQINLISHIDAVDMGYINEAREQERLLNESKENSVLTVRDVFYVDGVKHTLTGFEVQPYQYEDGDVSYNVVYVFRSGNSTKRVLDDDFFGLVEAGKVQAKNAYLKHLIASMQGESREGDAWGMMVLD